jgi:hypothetical protein
MAEDHEQDFIWHKRGLERHFKRGRNIWELILEQ